MTFRSEAGAGRRWRGVGAALLACLLVGVAGRVAWAQDVEAPEPATADAAAPAAPQASEETRARIAEAAAEAARMSALAEEWAARSADFAQVMQRAPENLLRLEEEVAKLKRREAPSVDVALPVAEIETDLLGSEQDLALARRELSAFEAELSGRAERRKQIPERLAAAKQRLVALDAEPAAPAADPALAEARQRLSQARREAIEREISAYQEELRSYEVRGQLLALRRERAALRVAELGARVQALQAAFSARRQGEAEMAAREAELPLEIAESLPDAVVAALRTVAAENQELAQRRTGPKGLLQRIEDTTSKLSRAEQQVADVSAALERLKSSVGESSRSGAVGVLLRRARSDLPDAGMYRRFIRMRRDQIGDVQSEQVRLMERRRALDDIDVAAAEYMERLRAQLSAEDRAAIEELLQQLLETRRRYLDTLVADTEIYFERLVDFDARQQELVDRTGELERFIDERVLWIPSGEALPDTFAEDVRDALAWLLAPRFWGQVLRAFRSSFARSPLVFSAATLLLLALPFAWPRIREKVKRLGDDASDPRCIRLEPTAAALALSLVLALAGPLLLAFLGWRLGVSVGATQFVRCVSSGLVAAAFIWASLNIPRQLLRSGGIAAAHLGWPEAPCRDLRRQLRWLSLLVVPAVFLIELFNARDEGAWMESVGRLVFVVTVLAVAAFTHRILREGGALRRIALASEERVPPWVWSVVHVGAVVLAVGLVAGALRGYFWTALQLATSVHVTLVFLLLVLFAHRLGTRWLLLASRRLALRRWQKAQAEREERKDAEQDPQAPDVAEPEVDLATVDAQTGRVLRNGALLAAAIGVWMLWSDLLPAGAALHSVELWRTNTTVTVETLNAAGEAISSVEERLVPITLADLLLALVIAAATLALARNLPGLLEISVFRQLGTSAGERYAYTTIAKYIVTLVGLSAALEAVGVGWASIQWMLAAVGIGLGFGLQEIFANFISGLIILFERPIRVGDTVTVGDISGTVSRIRIRATWITGFDRKELVVPNKEFITGRLVNWSLSDAVLRVEIPVGIAYGSDTQRAQQVLEEVARNNRQVLTEPPPQVLFRAFGASSLDFELRVFSPDVSHYLKIVHELHMEIDRAFRAEGIEIAFPQRDIHVRSGPPKRPELPTDAQA